MKIKNQSQRLLLFLIFPTLLKTNKDQIFWHKNSFKNLLKIENFTLEIVVQDQLKWGVFITPTNSARWQSSKGQNCPSGRPGGRSANGHNYDHWATGRPKTGNREQSSLLVDRAVDQGHFQIAEALWQSTDPVDRPPSLGCVHVLCTSVDRLLPRSIGPVDRQTARSNL